MEGVAATLTLTATHIIAYLRNSHLDLSRLILKEHNMPNPALEALVVAIEANIPLLIRGTKALCKAYLDAGIAGNTPEEKEKALVAKFEPGFNKALEGFGLPGFLVSMCDGVFEGIVKSSVEAVETSA